MSITKKTKKKTAKVAKKQRRRGSIAKLTPTRFIRLKLVQGVTGKALNAQIAKEYPEQGALMRTVPQHAKALEAEGITTDLNLFSTAQAACVLGIIPRRVAGLCAEGRLGNRLGAKSYVIEKADLIAFGSRVRTSGVPGQKARQAERARSARKNANGNSKRK